MTHNELQFYFLASQMLKVIVQQFFMLRDSRPSSLLERIHDIGFNIRFAMIGLFENLNISTISPGDSFSLFGEQMLIESSNVEKQKQQLTRKLCLIPWLTYRTGFPMLYNDINGSYVSDTGWGCMVRVGQMLFAEIIRTHLGIRTHEQMENVIEMFNDCDSMSPFSIHNISRIARRQFNKLPGSWYNPSQISQILSIIHQQRLEKQHRLAFEVFHGSIYFDQIVQKMLNGKEQLNCECKKQPHQIICADCNKQQFGVGLVVETMIGQKAPEQKYLEVLLDLMRIKASKGVIGGRPKKALYFIGTYNNDNMIYLDPHYVQSASQNLQSIKESYFCGSFRTCNAKSIDPSMGLCFYLRNFQELNQFYADIENVRKRYEKNDFFLGIDLNTPTYVSRNLMLTQEMEIDDDQFQQL